MISLRAFLSIVSAHSEAKNMNFVLLVSILLTFCFSGIVSANSKCQKANHYCKEFYHYEIHGEKHASGHSRKILDFLSTRKKGQAIEARGFFCLLYHPPCIKENHTKGLSLQPKPCRSICAKTWKFMKRTKKGKALWPRHFRCEELSNQDCYQFTDNLQIEYTKNSNAKHESSAKGEKHHRRGKHLRKHKAPKKIQAPPKIHLLSDDDNVVEVVSYGGDSVWQKKEALEYGANLEYYHGWADVQGKGSNNDYCRVIGGGHRIFLACALDGVVSKVHEYVSKLGFEPGYKGSWYMQDEDLDGRDDYCRCVKQGHSSHVSCMKAGERGFYGGPLVGGDQFTFTVHGSHGCHKKHQYRW